MRGVGGGGRVGGFLKSFREWGGSKCIFPRRVFVGEAGEGLAEGRGAVGFAPWGGLPFRGRSIGCVVVTAATWSVTSFGGLWGGTGAGGPPRALSRGRPRVAGPVRGVRGRCWPGSRRTCSRWSRDRALAGVEVGQRWVELVVETGEEDQRDRTSRRARATLHAARRHALKTAKKADRTRGAHVCHEVRDGLTKTVRDYRDLVIES